MPYFHATRADRLPSILRHGLGAIDTGPNAETCERGVYLANDPRLSLLVMLAQYAATGAAESRPRTEFESWRVIVIDDARIVPALLAPDPQVSLWRGSWIYRGVLDIRGALILTADDIMNAADSIPDPAPDHWLGWNAGAA